MSTSARGTAKRDPVGVPAEHPMAASRCEICVRENYGCRKDWINQRTKIASSFVPILSSTASRILYASPSLLSLSLPSTSAARDGTGGDPSSKSRSREASGTDLPFRLGASSTWAGGGLSPSQARGGSLVHVVHRNRRMALCRRRHEARCDLPQP